MYGKTKQIQNARRENVSAIFAKRRENALHVRDLSHLTVFRDTRMCTVAKRGAGNEEAFGTTAYGTHSPNVTRH
jgi:hypothetical protein